MPQPDQNDAAKLSKDTKNPTNHIEISLFNTIGKNFFYRD